MHFQQKNMKWTKRKTKLLDTETRRYRTISCWSLSSHWGEIKAVKLPNPHRTELKDYENHTRIELELSVLAKKSNRTLNSVELEPNRNEPVSFVAMTMPALILVAVSFWNRCWQLRPLIVDKSAFFYLLSFRWNFLILYNCLVSFQPPSPYTFTYLLNN